MKNLLPSTLAAAMIAVAPLAAQDKDALRFGGGLSYVILGGDFSDIVSGGFGLSVFGQKPLSDKLAIRGSVEHIIFGNKANKYDVHDVRRWGIAVDGIWSFIGHDKGPYALASLGFQHTAWERAGDWYDEEGASKSWSTPIFAVGFGYNVTRWLKVEVGLTGSEHKWSKSSLEP